jgi:hypothetical protein
MLTYSIVFSGTGPSHEGESQHPKTVIDSLDRLLQLVVHNQLGTLTRPYTPVQPLRLLLLISAVTRSMPMESLPILI